MSGSHWRVGDLAARARVAAIVALVAIIPFGLSGCDGTDPIPCADTLDQPAQIPSSSTLAPGETLTIRVGGIAGRRFCDGTLTRRDVVTWRSTNGAVASVQALDSLSARVTAHAVGQALILSESVETTRWGGVTSVVVVAR